MQRCPNCKYLALAWDDYFELWECHNCGAQYDADGYGNPDTRTGAA